MRPSRSGTGPGSEQAYRQRQSRHGSTVQVNLRHFGWLTMSVRKLQSLWRDSEGSALVEGALVVPILCMLLFGVFEFSWLFYQQHLISTGIRDAARYIARTANPNDVTIQTGAKNLATTGAIDGNTARVNGWWMRDVDITYASVDNPVGVNGLSRFRGGALIQSVTV